MKPRVPLSASSPGVPVWVQWTAYAIVCSIACLAEGLRWSNPQSRLDALTGWLSGPNADWLPFLPLLLTAPIWMGIPGGRGTARKPSAWRVWLQESAGTSKHLTGTWIAAIGVFLLAFAVSRMAAGTFQGAPPAYHDEYSYLFQAETYLQGHWTVPSDPSHPEWFDQMHVLNEGRFASRYFPGVGFWMMPFVALGDPWLGYQLAQGIAALLVFWIGRELSSNGVGLLAGVLFALSPGMILFSTLLLAHHPTLVGLLLFAWSFLRWLRRGGRWMLLLAGCGLSYAMLCRPMTAAGFGLPFGICFAAWWLGVGSRTRPLTEPRPVRGLGVRSVDALILAAPLLLGFLVQSISNHAITGSWRTTPYQQYTDIYTPRHRYGFNNVIEGEKQLGPKVLDNYDRWAENLTPGLAAKNVWTRLEASLRWSLGIVPLLLGGIVCLLTPRMGDRRWLLAWLSILSLHLVHIPYWFSGIMGWHYVLESAPLWILIFAEGTHRLIQSWRDVQLPGLILWWRLLIATAVTVNTITFVPVWPGRVEQGVAELSFPRRRYQAFRQQIEVLRGGRNAVVFVIPDDSDRHMDYVTNSPGLDGPVVVVRMRDRSQLHAAAANFPDRVPLVFDAAQRQLTRLKPEENSSKPTPSSH
ncbi:ArnT family glycosyltransferase [Planctomicrobium sp. SH661]|uniref:ArnT family glycosyltransferase n=1 Tax=Planctomicrobium sp. SH661 TaxID=3448124 RepID=UPI003F5BB0AF